MYNDSFFLLDLEELSGEQYTKRLDENGTERNVSVIDGLQEKGKELDPSPQLLLEQTITAFENKQYQLCLPALFSLIESSMLGFMGSERNPTKYNNKFIKPKTGADYSVADESPRNILKKQ
jgi:hypothetical protein